MDTALSQYARNGFGKCSRRVTSRSYRYDGSFAGLGGCPYAPGASGNLATEIFFICAKM